LEVCQKRFTVAVVFFEATKRVWSHSRFFPNSIAVSTALDSALE